MNYASYKTNDCKGSDITHQLLEVFDSINEAHKKIERWDKMNANLCKCKYLIKEQ